MNTTRHYVEPSVLSGLYNYIDKFEWVDFNNDVKFVKLMKNYLFSKLPEHAERFYHPEFEERILRAIDEFEPDVIQIESVYLTTYLDAIQKRTKALKVLRSHNIEYHIWHGLAIKARNRLRKKYLHNLTHRLKNFERRAWRKYDLILPITEKDSFHITRLEKITDMVVAPFSIEIKDIVPHHENENWVGYHIGAMDWIPNRDGIAWFLQHVWPKVHNRLPKFEFYFAGRNMPDDFKNLKIEGVHCAGEVADANEFIADKRILIVPVTTTGGIRVKILEAWAAGKIVITTPEGVKGLDAKPSEHFLLARKPDEFVKAIKWCMTNKAEAEQMAEKARQLVINKYQHRNVIKKVIDKIEIYLELR